MSDKTEKYRHQIYLEFYIVLTPIKLLQYTFIIRKPLNYLGCFVSCRYLKMITSR